MGSVVKALNPVKVVKGIFKKSSGGGSTASTSQTNVNEAQYQEKVRGDNQADVSQVGGYGSDLQPSRPATELTGLGGGNREQMKLAKRKALGG